MPPSNEDDLPTMFDPSTCVRKGFCSVESTHHSLYYEQHGTGQQKVIFVNGLNTNSFGWNAQVRLFSTSPEYSILVFDNRGVGYSEYPPGRYTTSKMAEDAVVLLDYLGWTAKRELHVIGVSLGGMIAQELATRIPDRVVSLTLSSTTPGGRPWSNFPPWEGTLSLLKLLVTSDINKKATVAMHMLFPISWLDRAAENDTSHRTNRQVQMENYLRRVALTRKQRFIGHLSQMSAGLTHRMTPERLRAIAGSIPKITIICGDQDHLMNPQHSQELKQHMPGAELIQFEETGHTIHSQWPQAFHDILVKTFMEGMSKTI